MGVEWAMPPVVVLDLVQQRQNLPPSVELVSTSLIVRVQVEVGA